MLEILDVSYNSLEGTLSRTFFSSFINLRGLVLSDNSRLVISIEEDWIPPFNLDIILLGSYELGPRFPKWIQLQTNFSYFDISNTSIFDSIPVSFWNSLSSNLLYLNMSYNQFYGTLPNLLDISYAFEIDLSSNHFEGVVPSGLALNTSFLYLNDNRFSNCSYFLCPKAESILEILDLPNNLCFGELPDCWMNFTQLTSLHLENNRFSGKIPNSIGYNLLSGYIPPRIGNASRSLGALILRKNHFIGAIPESICQFKNLQILDLAINRILGVIPNCIGNLMAMMKGIKNLGMYFDSGVLALNEHYEPETKTDTVVVSWKRVEQRFKETIKFVKYIDLSRNELSGEIPDGISILSGLESLDLSKNKLSGNIPFEIGNLTAL
ncbi:receptor-like protein EIX2 [Silene latifolia]|uniref:receptor-like protein EIX2 n=1 Tax=Silene latifolia TaxID=37657 RepID=UPI003D76C46E